MDKREQIISNYIEGYNGFDIERMVADFSSDIIFQNIQNGVVSMSLNGLEDFVRQAEVSKSYLSVRKQVVKSFRHENDVTETEIEYFGVLAKDFPNGMKKGQEIKLSGKSVFEFRNDKIVRLTDIS